MEGWYQISKCQGSGLIEDHSAFAQLLLVKVERAVRMYKKYIVQESQNVSFSPGTSGHYKYCTEVLPLGAKISASNPA